MITLLACRAFLTANPGPHEHGTMAASPLQHRSVVELTGGGELEAVGNILDKEF
jgi:hypothetical protein